MVWLNSVDERYGLGSSGKSVLRSRGVRVRVVHSPGTPSPGRVDGKLSLYPTRDDNNPYRYPRLTSLCFGRDLFFFFLFPQTWMTPSPLTGIFFFFDHDWSSIDRGRRGQTYRTGKKCPGVVYFSSWTFPVTNFAILKSPPYISPTPTLVSGWRVKER